MQNEPNKKPHGWKLFLRDHGYYIVLVLCVAAVGVSGYLFLRALSHGDEQPEAVATPVLSVPLTPTPSETAQQPKKQQETAAAETMAPTEEEPEEATVDAVAPEPETAEDLAKTVWPVAGEELAGWSADALAYNETLHDWRVHEGLDLAAAPGTEVVAARDGMVSAVWEDEALGTTVALEHEGGYTSCYSNLAADPPVQIGQALCAGEVLGSVGDTASSELALGGHLHFAVSCSGQSMDPKLFLED